MDKREFIKLAGMSTAYAAVSGLPSIASSQPLSHEAIIRMSLVEGVRALAFGNVSSQDYCVAALAQAARFESYNIFTQISSTYVRNTAAAADASFVTRETGCQGRSSGVGRPGSCFLFEPDLREAHEAYEVIARFFNEHLGRKCAQ